MHELSAGEFPNISPIPTDFLESNRNSDRKTYPKPTPHTHKYSRGGCRIVRMPMGRINWELTQLLLAPGAANGIAFSVQKSKNMKETKKDMASK